MLHVDARGDTYISVSDTVNIPDDVVFTPEGRIGVGTLNPQARLHIVSPTPGAIRIADGTEGGGKILMSDANGTAKWTNIAGSWYAAFRGGESLGTARTGTIYDVWPLFTYASSEIYPPGTGSIDLATGTIQAPYTGMYRVTITGNAYINVSTTFYLAYVNVKVNDTSQFTPHVHIFRNLGAMDFGFLIILLLNEGDVVTMEPQRHSSTGANPFYCANEYRDVVLHIEFVK